MNRTSQDLVIRPLVPADAEFCFRVRAEAFILQFCTELGPEAVATGVNAYMPSDYLAMARSMPTFVAELAGDPVGFCMCRRADGPAGEILLLYVRGGEQGHGVGRGLVAHAESWMRAHWPGLRRLVVDTVVPARNQGFYERMGYRPAGEHPYEFPGRTVRAVRLEKALPPAEGP